MPFLSYAWDGMGEGDVTLPDGEDTRFDMLDKRLALGSLVLVFVAMFYLAMCEPALAQDGSSKLWDWLFVIITGGTAAAAAGKGAHVVLRRPDVYPVWYGTNRKLGNGAYTSTLATKMDFGICEVAVPKAHKFGSTGSAVLVRFWQRIQTGGVDDKLDIIRRIELSKDMFLTTMEDGVETDNHVLVYIHGYGNTFDTAIIRAGQIGFDLKVDVMAAFCWASKGELTEPAYYADRDTALLSERHLGKFLSLIHENFLKHKINILAHSMGNRILLGVLEQLHKYPSLKRAHFGQIFLAAPDIDAQYFKTVSKLYTARCERTTLYVCSDKALRLADFLVDDQRLGYIPPITVVRGIDTIEATNVAIDLIGHSYYAEASALLYDLFTLLRNNAVPDARAGLMKLEAEDGSRYWALRAVNT